MIDAAIELARPKRLMAGMDEVRGINRDSRSRRLGMGNGRIFAHAMNRLAACVRRSAECLQCVHSPASPELPRTQ